jgi:hypothetical protein
MGDYFDNFPAEFVEEVRTIHQQNRNNNQLNKALVEFYIANGNRIGLPHNCKCLVTDELRHYLRGWGWTDDYIGKRLTATYVISSYIGGGSPALTTPDGGWIGAVEWDIVRRLRAAYIEGAV